MKQRVLEIRLQELEGFARSRADLEQYPTPAKIAADVLYIAHAHGDVDGKRVLDLGCGTGIFSIGSCLLGAREVVGLDIDKAALETAGRNAAASGCDIEFRCGPVESASGNFDTCIMNPPFGSQNRHADIPFLEKAMELAGTVYTMHNSGTVDFLRGLIGKSGRIPEIKRNYKFEIRHTFNFHRKEKAYFDVTLLRIVRP
ncbi:MAG: METTL5 family protein [Candidatus Thermoplasmatota archaeon]|nr:methyltransferase [Euryarchaeota archaeon]MBU4032039.1 METTL5 family protein [Candidatus Thermoplasmatota archaeon]MBU4070733.1 METTL5 family protein [Candidatus Thermoplasmatota archaeon]MBU4145171.1 METTL5 family protein [Candidatus Thermoplasmatota archaeon]MBU4591529.1 METTL5 family protein [Candidatus Thermoplasmatota archaeon]